MEEDASARVQLAIASPTGFSENAELIFDNLAHNSKAYTDSFTKSLAQVFPSSDYPPVSKFYALYLLAKASESKNEFLAMRILKQRPLLDKLFKDCQYDGAKPMNERGKTFFSKTPKTEEIILGGNYIRLLLELFTFWNKTYGTTDNQNPLHAYQVMFNTLAQKINFPETFLYLGKTYMITEDFHLLPPPSLPSLDALRSRSNSPERSVKSASPDPKNTINTIEMSDIGSSQKKSAIGMSLNQSSPTKPTTQQAQAQVNNNNKNASPTNPTNKSNTNNTTSPITVHTTVTNIAEDVKACIPSGKLYKQKSAKVFDALRKSPSKESISAYINVTREVLKSKEQPPVSKFYAVYLLLRLTETKAQPLIQGLATNQDLLNELFLQAQVDRQKETRERGKKIFSAKPTSDEAKLGHNYLVLITEALIFWKRTFNSESKKDPLNVFTVIYSTLETKTKLPQNFYYVGKTLDTDNDSLPTKFELIAPEDLQKQSTKSPQTTSPTTKLTDQPQTQTQKPPSKEEPSLRKLQESLDKLDAEKGSLREVLENNTEENELKELLEYMFKEISDTFNNSVSPQVEPLLSGSVPNSERLVTQVYTEAELVDKLNSHYDSYKKGKLPYRELRARALVLLKPQENPYAGGVTPGGEEVIEKSQAIKQVQEEVKQEEIVYREYANEQPQERTKKSAAVNTLKIETPTSSVSQQNKIGKGLQAVENPNDNYLVENQQQQSWKSPENEKKSIVFGSVSNPISERAQDNKRIEFEQPPVHTEIEEKESQPVVYESQRQVQQIKSPVAVDNFPSNNNELPPKKHELDSHTYQFKSSANIEDDDASLGSGTLPPKQAITNKVSKFKAAETLEDDNIGNPSNIGNIGSSNIEAREVKSVRHPSPFRRPDDLEVVDADKSEKFNAYKSYSLRMTPSRNTENDQDQDLSKSMKLSRIKPGDLSMIESSIRQSFMSTGKRPPQFKPLSELQVKEDYEKEITRLRAEKDALLKENSSLNLALRECEQNPRIIEEPVPGTKQRDAELKKLLNQQQEKIEALTQEITALTQENHKLQRRNSALEQYQYANKAEEENHSHYKEKIALQERIAELERELSQYQTGGKQGLLSKSAAQRAGGKTAPKIETANVEQVKRAGLPQQERLDTNPANISMGQTPYDVDWANATQPITSVDSSAYDVEWPASAYKEKGLLSADADLTKAIQGKNPEPNNKKSIRGIPIETSNPIFGNLKPQIRGLPWTNDLKSFKVACLKEKCPLFENEMVRVGVSSTIVHDNSNHKNMLKLVLYFENKSEQLIDSFETEVINAKGLSKIAKPSHLQAPIEKGRQVKQQIIVAFDKIPFECLQLLVNIRTGGTNIETVNLFLPTLITRFMEFKYATPEVFREKWKLKNTNVLKTEEITLDNNVIKNALDFKKYFGYLIDLKPMDEYDFVQGKKSIKLAGVFELDVPNAEYLLKINVLPTHQVVFQIASFEADGNIARFILQTLAFLFRKN